MQQVPAVDAWRAVQKTRGGKLDNIHPEESHHLKWNQIWHSKSSHIQGMNLLHKIIYDETRGTLPGAPHFFTEDSNIGKHKPSG